jgi:hypothetical protein
MEEKRMATETNALKEEIHALLMKAGEIQGWGHVDEDVANFLEDNSVDETTTDNWWEMDADVQVQLLADFINEGVFKKEDLIEVLNNLVGEDDENEDEGEDDDAPF